MSDPGKRDGQGGKTTPEENLKRTARRAKTKVRRYCVANGLFRMWTLTYGADLGPRATTHAQVVADVARFIKVLRAELHLVGREPMAYVWVPELHRDGVHYHVHLLIDRYVSHSTMARCWGLGFVGVPKGKNKQGQQIRGKGAVKRAAGYASKYVGKTYEDMGAGAHRYEVGQGCQPLSVAVATGSLTSFLGMASLSFGGEVPSSAWSSSSVEAWTGPPVHMWFWDEDER